MRHFTTLIPLLAATLFIAGCGGSGSELEGIYQTATWTENTTSCDSEGDSILEEESQTIFYIKHENFLGEKFLNLMYCDDQADCEAMAGEGDTIHLGGFIFEQGNDDSGWTEGWYSGFAQDNVCDGSYAVSTLTGVPGESVRVEVRMTAAGGFPPDSDGFCDDDDGAAAAEGQPCTNLSVITASFLADLP